MSTKGSKKPTARRKSSLPNNAVHNIVDALLDLAQPLTDLRPSSSNARVHTEANIREIKASMREFGQDVPVVANRTDGEVVKGNGRLQAAQELGWTHLAVVWVEDNSERAIARAIADNAVALSSVWDDEVLGQQLQVIETEEAELRRVYGDLELEIAESEEEEAEEGGARGSRTQGDPVPEMEIRPGEHFDFIMVMSENVHEWNRLVSLLGLTTDAVSRAGRRKVGVARAVRAADLLAVIDVQ